MILKVNFTSNGTAKGAPCVLPYIYNKNSYNSCITLNHHTLWCSTTSNYDTDLQWGECLSYDVCLLHDTVSDPWRNIGFNPTTFSGWPMNDVSLKEGWYRFTGVGGDVLSNACLNNSRGSNRMFSFGSCSDPYTISSDHYLQNCDFGISGSSGCIATNRSLNRIFCGRYYLYYLYPIDQCFSTRHSSCNASSCGPNAHCNPSDGSCECDSGFSIPDRFLPTGSSYGCQEIFTSAGTTQPKHIWAHHELSQLSGKSLLIQKPSEGLLRGLLR
ncbi:uncharacterized protein [Salminus brasiliensis]|uniref:uncharacterized protein n=1 Tax=Salminus brasiliensis TaxID=930266 RepID=UPI003B8367C9